MFCPFLLSKSLSFFLFSVQCGNIVYISFQFLCKSSNINKRLPLSLTYNDWHEMEMIAKIGKKNRISTTDAEIGFIRYKWTSYFTERYLCKWETMSTHTPEKKRKQRLKVFVYVYILPSHKLPTTYKTHIFFEPTMYSQKHSTIYKWKNIFLEIERELKGKNGEFIL